MADIEQVSENLWMSSSELFTYHSGIFVSNGAAVVIDPGLAETEIQTLSRFISEQKWDVQAVILTHGHWDHVLGTEAFPNVRIVAQREYLTSKRNDPVGIRRIVEQTPDLGRTGPFRMPVPHETFGETMRLLVGALELELVHTPGHAPDHLFVYERKSGTVWTADMLSNEEIPYVIDNLAVFERTLENIRSDDCRLLIPCHGTATSDATGEYAHASKTITLMFRSGAGASSGQRRRAKRSAKPRRCVRLSRIANPFKTIKRRMSATLNLRMSNSADPLMLNPLAGSARGLISLRSECCTQSRILAGGVL